MEKSYLKLSLLFFMFYSFFLFVSCSNSSGSGSGDSSDQESVPLIVFASDSDGDFEIYSLDPNNLSAAAIQLTDNSAVEKHPSLTKDGSKIVFVSDRNSGNFEIFTMNSDGSNVSSALVTLGGASDGNPSWNNDGSRIVYDDGGDLYVMDADGANQANITNPSGSRPGIVENKSSWRSESGIIIYERDGGDIYETDESGSFHTQIIVAAFVIEGDPCLSHNGTMIVFTRNSGSNTAIHTIKTDNTDLINITNTTGSNESSPAWSSDGNSIAYVRGGAVYSKNADGSGSETLITANGSDPSW